jgi:dihydroorotate dehydrogenase
LIYEALFFVLKRLDPELTHEWGMRVIALASQWPLRSLLRQKTAPSPSQRVNALGLSFGSPLGLAAGFDKNATAVSGMFALGFDHVEVGTITALPQPGNPKPRLFRLPDDEALINRMGFNNDGARVVAARLRALRAKGATLPIIGVNIGKSRVTAITNATSDYVTSAKLLAPVADYLVVNVSSPNTPGLRGLQHEKELSPLLKAVKTAAGNTPVLVKIAPDLEAKEIASVCKLVMKLDLAGIVATNTTISRDGLTASPEDLARLGEGGLSGAPLRERSREVLDLVRQILPREVCVISVGGIFDGADVAERLDAGATLVQAYTGFVYRGPLFAAKVTKELQAATA